MPVSLASDVCAYVALDPRALHMGLRVMCTDEQTSVRCASSIPSLAASGKMPETRCMSLPLKYKTCSKRVSKRRAVALAAAATKREAAEVGVPRSGTRGPVPT